jgi:membrane-bound lytic murein transglycosylase F
MRNLLPIKIAALVLLCILLVLSFSVQVPVEDWRRGELVVIVPPVDSLDHQFNKQMAELFAAELGVKIRVMELYPHQVSNALANKYAHFSAIGARVNKLDTSKKYGVPYQVVSEMLVCNGEQPETNEELNAREIIVVRDSAQESALRAAQSENKSLKWKTLDKVRTGDLLEDVSNQEIDCTVANEEQIAFMRNFHTTLEPTFEISTPTELAWTFAADVDVELYAKMEHFFARIEADGTLERLIEQHYGHNDRIVSIDAEAFLNKTITVLPQYRHLFEEAADLTGIEWQLLAAMGYRESHWNPLATSYTKVRGMMMLTEDTADRMKISNRLDPGESIMAGAKYLQLLKNQLPLRIQEPERTWLALAAYNKGMGHLEDARVLTQRYDLNPDLWSDVKKSMVKLRNPAIAKTLKHGYARGGEAVVYVETVRLYHDMLKRLSREEYKQLLPPDYQIKLNAW